ncbi:hypothetical protein, partial [Legionella sp.]|uniref:hypothetical protein n=1 Tax=Legionella sp. TaxID=459 RepID=UPI000CC5EEFB
MKENQDKTLPKNQRKTLPHSKSDPTTTLRESPEEENMRGRFRRALGSFGSLTSFFPTSGGISPRKKNKTVTEEDIAIAGESEFNAPSSSGLDGESLPCKDNEKGKEKEKVKKKKNKKRTEENFFYEENGKKHLIPIGSETDGDKSSKGKKYIIRPDDTDIEIEDEDAAEASILPLEEPESPQSAKRWSMKPRSNNLKLDSLFIEGIGDSVEMSEEREPHLSWHTKESMEELIWKQNLQAIEKREIQLLEEICADLDLVFQQFAKLIESDDDEGQRQLGAFWHYLKACIECITTNSTEMKNIRELEQIYKLIIEKYLPGPIQFSKEKVELRLQNQIRIQLLRFHEMEKIGPPFHKIMPFMAKHLNVEEYNDQLNKLMELAISRQEYLMSNVKLAELRENLTHKIVPQGYISLDSLLPQNGNLARIVIQRLAKELSSDRNSHFPDCQLNEDDFYILNESPLHEALIARIDDFLRDHKKLYEK